MPHGLLSFLLSAFLSYSLKYVFWCYESFVCLMSCVCPQYSCLVSLHKAPKARAIAHQRKLPPPRLMSPPTKPFLLRTCITFLAYWPLFLRHSQCLHNCLLHATQICKLLHMYFSLSFLCMLYMSISIVSVSLLSLFLCTHSVYCSY
jgi:hypothetical protein